MKRIISINILLFFSLSIFGQHIVFPGQNQFYRFLEDPSFISMDGKYNMTGMLQVSDSDIAQTSQYLAAQLAFFDNVAFGLEYSRHSLDFYRYSQLLINARVRLGLGQEYHYFSLGFGVGPDKSFQSPTVLENETSTIYRLAAHYTNYNLTVGGFLNHYPVHTVLNNAPIFDKYKGYSVYASYNIGLSDNLRLTPLFRYNSYEDLNFVEGVAILNYKGNVELAASYKNDYSMNAALSAKLFKRVKLSYSYEKAMGIQNFNDVHAIGISVDLAARATDEPEWLANVKRNNAKMQSMKPRKSEEKETVAEEVDLNEQNIQETVSDTLTNVAEIDEKMVEYPPMDESSPEDTINNQLKPGYYIILGSFVELENANKEVERLKSNGYYARIGKQNANDKFNYIYVDRYTDRQIAIERTKAKQKEKGFEKVWLLRIK